MAVVPPAPTRRRRAISRRVTGTGLVAVAAMLWISPLLLLVLTSIRSADDFVARGPVSWPAEFSLSSFASAWSTGQFAESFVNSFLVTMVKVPIGVAISALLAYALAKLELRFGRAVLFAVLLGLTVPIFIAVIPLFGMLRSVGLTDSIWGLVPAYLAFGIPLQVFILHAFFRSVPDEILDAARVDGAGSFRAFVQIVIPLSTPALITVFILDAVATWNELVMALILLSSPDSRTVPLGLLNFQSQFTTDFTGLSAGVLIGIAPILLAFVLLQRFVVSGLTAGAVKG